MGQALLETNSYERMQCGECGITFWIPTSLYDECRKVKGKGWHCPNGHARVFSESAVEKLQRQLDAERTRNAEIMKQRDQAERKLKSKERVLKRMTNRVAHGVCPCCNRTFQNLQRHMSTKHPDFEKTEQI